MADLDTAIKIAVDAHAGQVDKAGEPYILHPLRVMLAMKDETRRIVAVVHDVWEDSANGREYFVDAGFTRDVILAIDALTRRPDETYAEFIGRVCKNPIAIDVKLADIADNTSPARSASLPPHLAERYAKARVRLEAARTEREKQG